MTSSTRNQNDFSSEHTKMYVNVKNHEDDEVIDGSKQANVL